MSQIELFRQSKAPVKLENYKLYQEAWVKYFDAVMAKHGQDMEKVHKLLEKGELRLNRKYNGKVLVDYPSTKEQLNALCDEYKVPIMFAQRADGTDIVGVLMDDFGS